MSNKGFLDKFYLSLCILTFSTLSVGLTACPRDIAAPCNPVPSTTRYPNTEKDNICSSCQDICEPDSTSKKCVQQIKKGFCLNYDTCGPREARCGTNTNFKSTSVHMTSYTHPPTPISTMECNCSSQIRLIIVLVVVVIVLFGLLVASHRATIKRKFNSRVRRRTPVCDDCNGHLLHASESQTKLDGVTPGSEKTDEPAAIASAPTDEHEVAIDVENHEYIQAVQPTEQAAGGAPILMTGESEEDTVVKVNTQYDGNELSISQEEKAIRLLNSADDGRNDAYSSSSNAQISRHSSQDIVLDSGHHTSADVDTSDVSMEMDGPETTERTPRRRTVNERSLGRSDLHAQVTCFPYGGTTPELML